MKTPAEIIIDQRAYFHNTLRFTSLFDRKQKLSKIKKWIKANETKIAEAAYNDFKKPQEEVLFSEIKPVLEEIKDASNNLRDWAAEKKVNTPLYLLGSRSKILKEPKGVCLIIAPWNFPFMLSIGPLISAIAAGNCAVLKPSEMTPHMELLIKTMIADLFPPEEITVVTGGIEISKDLLSLKWDHIFFTGSPQVGKIIMKAAAEHLTSVTLELGGKNPVIIDETAKLKDTAEKLIWGKFFNCGQSCISPNYLMVHKSIQNKFISELKNAFLKIYGLDADIYSNTAFARIVNENHFKRVKNLIDKTLDQGAELVIGNHTKSEENFISPTILNNITTDSEIFQDEIFGPVLPIIPYSNLDDVIKIIQKEEKPLALYIFSSSRKNTNRIINETSSGTIAVNETTVQFIHPNLPFGGVNHSGLGKSHGKYGYDQFTNERSIFTQRRGFTTVKLIHPPYNNFKRFVLKFMTWWM